MRPKQTIGKRLLIKKQRADLKSLFAKYRAKSMVRNLLIECNDTIKEMDRMRREYYQFRDFRTDIPSPSPSLLLHQEPPPDSLQHIDGCKSNPLD
jgi:hypothetical protein